MTKVDDIIPCQTKEITLQQNKECMKKRKHSFYFLRNFKITFFSKKLINSYVIDIYLPGFEHKCCKEDHSISPCVSVDTKKERAI